MVKESFVFRCSSTRLSYFYAVRFSFQLELDKKQLTFEVERIYRSRQTERFKVMPIGAKVFIIVQCDRPNIELRKLQKPINWHKVEGYITDPHTLQLIYQEIENAFDSPPPAFQGTLNL